MFRQFTLIAALTFVPVTALVSSPRASAQIILDRATIATIRNRARLMPQNQAARPAKPSDTMNPGDSLATAAASTADLRFNDNSLARLGEQTVFRFAPRTRALDLANGTVLLLVRPGSGGTSVRTPNAAAGIRGSALFVRYIPATNTTLIGALTTSGITAFNGEATQRIELKGGQMAAIVGDRIEGVYYFDLAEFYQTSTLVKGLDLTATHTASDDDPTLAAVRVEIAAALAAQSPRNGAATPLNASFVLLPVPRQQDFPEATIPTVDFEFSPDSVSADAIASTASDRMAIHSSLSGGELQFNSSVLSISGGAVGNNANSNSRGTVFPGGGSTNGIFPGQGSTGGVFPPQRP
jgi:hypothetical protein